MMLVIVSLGLMVSGLGIAIAAQLERPTLTFIAATIANALIFNSVEAGNETVGWLSLPVTALCLPGLLDLRKRWTNSQMELREDDRMQNEEFAEAPPDMIQEQDLARGKPDLSTLAIIGVGLLGIALLTTMLDRTPGIIRLIAGASWGAIVFLGWHLTTRFLSR